MASTHAGAPGTSRQRDGAESATRGPATPRPLRGESTATTAATPFTIPRSHSTGDQGVETGRGLLERNEGNGGANDAAPPATATSADRGDVLHSAQVQDSSDGDSATSTQGNQDACSGEISGGDDDGSRNTREASSFTPYTSPSPPAVDVEDSGITSAQTKTCLLYTSPSPRDLSTSRMPSSA